MKNLDPYSGKSFLMAFLCLGGSLSAQAQCDFAITGVVTQPNCGMSDGIIQLLISEGADVYSIDWSTGAQGPLLTDQSPGYYSVTVMDWEGCTTTAEFVLACDDGEAGGPSEGGGDAEFDEDCTMKTFTQGGWGSKPHGNNPGTYLHANFSAAFPNGLTIGCDRQLRLTTAQAVTNYLPGGGPPSMLPAGITTNPTKYKNVLAAQLVAATLNVGMDSYDAGFAPSGNSLANSIINSGPFEGHTVQQLLDLANAYIGNCGGTYSASQFNEALSAINENYVDGSTDGGFLSCGPGPKSMLLTEAPQLLGVFPNPASSTATLRMTAPRGVVVSIELVDLTGRVVSPRTVRTVEAGHLQITMDVSGLREGLYFIRLGHSGQETITRLVVTH